MSTDAGRSRRMLSTREEAEDFLASFTATMSELQAVLEHETEELTAGRIRSALSQEERKGKLAAGYLRGLELARSNAVALARFAPGAVGRLKEAHGGFRASLDRNQAVLATAKAVSEGLVKGVADEMAKRTRPSGYGAAAAGRATVAPLSHSSRI
jgi:hypothetical protein